MKIKTLIIIGAASLLLGVWQLAGNARSAASLRDQIMAKDQAAGDTTADITNLTTFVHSHMRASVSFELTASYDRDNAKAQAAAQPTGTVYAQAQASCAKLKNPVDQSHCVSSYVSAHLQPASTIPAVDRSHYQYALHSPLWTPDLAGLSLLAGIICLVVAAWLKI